MQHHQQQQTGGFRPINGVKRTFPTAFQQQQTQSFNLNNNNNNNKTANNNLTNIKSNSNNTNLNSGPNSRLMVYVRVKPIQDEKPIIDIIDEGRLIFDPRDTENQPIGEYFYHGKKFKSIGSKKNKNFEYSFDRIFDEDSTNYHIYETVTKPMVEATINGLNCSVFAYGATGSGKTFTMLGSPNCPGVIYHTSKDIFERMPDINDEDPLPAELKICYFEIYNEKIRDLLVIDQSDFICGSKRLRTTPERCRARRQLLPRDNYNLPVCEKPGDPTSLIIPDLTYHSPTNPEELLELIAAGNLNRSQHPTDANADSSRSHAIFQILLTRRVRPHNGCSNSADYELQTSKMSLIDLAGSERASVAYRAGNDRSKNLQREGGNINKSLLALGNCINALADPKRGNKHIPYRNSKLTRLLRDSLGGKCRTAMIATVCQQMNHYDDTQNTLFYAERAKCIKLRPGRNFTETAIQPKHYNTVIEKQNKQILTLQSENEELKKKFDDLLDKMNSAKRDDLQNQQLYNSPQIQRMNPNQTYIACKKRSQPNFLEESHFRQELEDLYDEKAAIHIEILKYESKFKMNELKLAFKRLDENRQQIIHGDIPSMNGNTTVLMATGATSAWNNPEHSQAIKTQLNFYDQERLALLDRAEANNEQLQNVLDSMASEYQMSGCGGKNEFDSLIGSFKEEKELIQALEEKKFCLQHAYDLAQIGFNRLLTTEDLLIEATNVVKITHAITKGRGLSDPLEAKLTHLLKKIEGKKSVVWKDDKYKIENDKDNEPAVAQLLNIHENFNLNFLTPYRNNNSVHSRRLSKNLVSLTNYTPEQSSNMTFDAM